MARMILMETTKTYSSEANAIRAVEKKYPKIDDGLRYFIVRNEHGRYFPVFVGESAIEMGVHFDFKVIA